MKLELDTLNFNQLLDGKQVGLYFLKNKNGLEAAITNYGARLVSLKVPNRNGEFSDVVLGFSSLREYQESNEPYFGATIGRYANRIANGSFRLGKREFLLAKNNGENHLHGGNCGFNVVVWDVLNVTKDSLKLAYLSADGEEGYPGNLKVTLNFQLNDFNEFRIDYEAMTDQPTLVNLTHHSFFNLAGEGVANLDSHHFVMNADYFIPVTDSLIPIGELAKVEGTPFDFRKAKPLDLLNFSNYEQLSFANGFDHNFVLNKSQNSNELSFAAKVIECISGRFMEVFTNEPGIQCYSGNFLNGEDIGKSGNAYLRHSAFCLESQHFPDSPNQAQFPSTVLDVGNTYQSTCVYKFGIEGGGDFIPEKQPNHLATKFSI
jgi:aldose 1-epimerase